MHHRCVQPDEHPTVVKLFADTFTASEGPAEGALISQLAHNLFATTPADDVICLVTTDAQNPILASIFLTRLTLHDTDGKLPGSPPEELSGAYLLAPVAVHPDHQRRGLGRALIQHGQTTAQQQHADLLLTYGDPAYYTPLGFAPISDQQLIPPYPLTYPEGWLAQPTTPENTPLSNLPITRLTCVPAFNNPAYW